MSLGSLQDEFFLPTLLVKRKRERRFYHLHLPLHSSSFVRGRRPQVAPVTRVSRIHVRKKKRELARYFLHARTCRNKGRPGKGRAGHEGTSDSRDVAPRKWIQLNSHTRRVGLKTPRDVSGDTRARENEESGKGRERRRESEPNPRQTNGKCVYPRNLLQTELNEPEISAVVCEETVSTFRSREWKRDARAIDAIGEKRRRRRERGHLAGNDLAPEGVASWQETSGCE